MRDKFGLEFGIVDTELMRALRRERGLHVNPWTRFPRLITSIDFLKRERPMRLFREVLHGPDELAYPRLFDLLIIDEAHNIAPSGRGKYATDSLRTLAVCTLTPHFEHRLWLREKLLAADGSWNSERVVIFTEYRDTQRWLHQLLTNADLGGGERLATLFGGMPSDQRERVKAAFQASPDLSPVRILLATDAASAGIDLQNHCSLLIHFEIPWNPNRMEQRNGRDDVVLAYLNHWLVAMALEARLATQWAQHGGR